MLLGSICAFVVKWDEFFRLDYSSGGSVLPQGVTALGTPRFKTVNIRSSQRPLG